MADIFDQLGSEGSGDIFDQAAGGDIFDQVAPDNSVGTGRGVLASAQRGVKNLLALPDAVMAAGADDLGKPKILNRRKAFESAMSDLDYSQRLTEAPTSEQAKKIEAAYGTNPRLEAAMLPGQTLQTAIAEDVAKTQGEIAALPKSEAQQRLADAKNSSEKWAAWRKDPFELTGSIVLESLPTSIAGALVGGAGGSVALGVGSSSLLQTFSAEFLNNAGALGYDVKDPQSLQQFLANEEDFQAAFKPAAVKASVIGQVDTVTAGAAGKFIEPALKQGLKAVAIAGAKELGMQAAGGSGGELLGSLAAGQKPDLFDVAMEGIAEIATGPGEAIGNIRQAVKESGKNSTQVKTDQLNQDVQATENLNQPPMSISPATNEAEKTDTPIEDLTAAVKDLAAAMRGESPESARLKQNAPDVQRSEPEVQPKDVLLQQAMADLPDDARAAIEARLLEQKAAEEAKPETSLTSLTSVESGGITAPDAAAGTVTGQNEGKASDATAGDIAAEQMPAEVVPKGQESGNAPTQNAPVTETPATPTKASTSKLSPGLTEKDGLLFELSSRHGRIPIFLPDNFTLANYRRLKAKVQTHSEGGLTPKEREYWRRLRERFTDKWEDLYGADGSMAYDAYRAAKRAGIASELFAPVNSVAELDRQLDAARETKGADYNLPDLWADVLRLSNAHAVEQEVGKQTREFDKRVLRGEGPKREKLDVFDSAELRPGDVFERQGHQFEVKSHEVDDGTPIVRVKDGPKFGEQTLYGNEKLHVDKGSMEFGPEHAEASEATTEQEPAEDDNTPFSLGEEFAFDAPESVDEQKARLAIEKQATAERKAREDMLQRAGKRLTANTDERTGDMFAAPEHRETRTDTGGQGSLFSLSQGGEKSSIARVEEIVGHELYRTGQPMNRFSVVYRPDWQRNGRYVQAMVSKDGRVTINAAAPGMRNEATVRKVVREEAAHLLLSSPEGREAIQRFVLEAMTPEIEQELRAAGYTGNRELLADEFIAKQARENTTWWQSLVDRIRAWLAKHGLADLTPAETARAILRSLASADSERATIGPNFSLAGYVPSKFAMSKPIKGPTGASIVGYEWRSTMGEKWSERRQEYVEARVSDWGNADESTGTGRSIVHVFYVTHPDGVVRPEGIRSAQNVLGISETRLMTIAKKERAAHQYREQQDKADVEAFEKLAKDTPAEAARDYRVKNSSPMRSFEENDALFKQSNLFEKDGKYVRRGPHATERMERFGWKLVQNDPAKPKPVSDESKPSLDADAARLERWIIDRADYYAKPENSAFGSSFDSRLKRVSEDIRAGKLPRELNEAAMHLLRPTRDQETGETLNWDDADFPRTATLLNFLQSRDRFPDDLFSLADSAEAIRDAEQDLQHAIRQHMSPPEGMTKAEALRIKNEAAMNLRRLQFEAMEDLTSPAAADVERTPEETSRMIAETVDLFNTIQDEISELNARSEAIPPGYTKLRNDLQARLNILKGWANDQTEAIAAGDREQPAPIEPADRGRQMTLEAATNPDRPTFGQFFDALKRGLRYFASPIPELPLSGESARKAALFRRGFRLFSAETNRVRQEAAEKVQKVLEPLASLRTRQDNDRLKRYYRLGAALDRARQAMDEQRVALLSKQLADLEQAGVNADPFNLFRKLVLYRDLWWRGTFLKTEQGKPITLPNGLTIDEIAAELRSLQQQLEDHPQRAAIQETLKRHYKLTDDLQKAILDHGEIIPEALRNPLYFPHHILEHWNGNIDKVRPSTEEDFRKYLIAPVGSGKLIQADYLKAMYMHTADVLAHNARTDLVKKYWQSYDISEQLKAEHGDNWDKPWNLPPGYKLFAPFKKLPLRMDYILSREVLADKLGVLFNDGDLRNRLGEAGQVLKVNPEDLHAAMVAGEKIKWAVPEEIADALEGISRREAARSNPGLGHALGTPFRGLNNFWKRVKLFAPWNWIRYEYGNMATDLVDKVLVADPKMAGYLKQAAGEILNASRTGEKSEAFKAASREGVFDTITASEAGELQRLREFAEFQSSGETARNTVHNFLAATTKASHFREATFRYAKFLADVDRIRSGEHPIYAGAYHEDIEALGDTPQGQQQMLQGDELTYAKAAEISLKTFGDYNSLGVVSQWLRTYAVPFWSWQDVNFRYHANQLRNIADGLRGIKGGTPRQVILKYAAVRVIATLTAVAIAQQLWNTIGGAMLGLWDDDDDLESQLSAADRRRSHVILGKDKNGNVLVVYTPSACADVAEWVGGLNMKRLFLEFAKGDITLKQMVADYAKQLPADVANKVAQSVGPLGKAPYEAISGQAVFPDVLDQRKIPAADRWWRLAGGMTDDRAVNWMRNVFDKDYYSQPANEQLQQMILQVRRRDPEQWAYYEAREDAADWKEKKTGKRFEAGSYDAPEAQVLRNFRRSIYRGDVAAAEQFYRRLLDYGYTSERLDASIRAQHPLADLSKEQRKEYLEQLDERSKRELALAESYYSRIGALDKREKRLFPSNYRVKHGRPFEPNDELLREVMTRD